MLIKWMRGFLVIAIGLSSRGYAGPDEVKLRNYFDSLTRETAAGFENWYPKKAGNKPEVIDNPRALSFDAAQALRGNWEPGVAYAAVASYHTRRKFTSIVSSFEDPGLIIEWLRRVRAVTYSELIDRTALEAPKIRMTFSMPFLEDLNGFYQFRRYTVSEQRTILRISRISVEGPTEDNEMMVLVDKSPDQTAFVHMVDVTILKSKYKNSWLGRLWFNFMNRKNMMALLRGLDTAADTSE